MKIIYSIYGIFRDPRHGKGQVSDYETKHAISKGHIKKIIALGKKGTLGSLDPNIICPAPFNGMLPRFAKGIQRWIYPGLNARDISESVYDIFAARNIDACHIFFAHGGNPVRALKKAKEKQCVTLFFGEAAHPEYNERLYKQECEKYGFSNNAPFGRIRDKDFLQHIDYLLATSDFVKKTYVKAGFDPCKVKNVSLGVDIKRFCPGEKKNTKFRCLFVGHMWLTKGVQYLLEAWDGLGLKEAELVLCGEMSANVRKIIKQFQKKNINVITTGKVDPLYYYQNSSVFVLPSLSEGFPKVILEAMACGLPVIATDNCRCIVEEGKDGFIVPIRDAESLGNKILSFYNDPDRTEEMGKNARLKAEKYTWESYGKRMCSMYEEVYAECY